MAKPDNFKTKKIFFYSDGFKLNGTLHLPGTYPHLAIIGSHGFSSSSESPKQIVLAKRCCENNIAFFRFDHRGCGESEGDFKKDTTFSGRCNDLSNAIRTILELDEVGNRIGLFGSSMGGATSIYVSDLFPIDVIGVIAAPVRLSQINSAPDEIKENLDVHPLEFNESLEFDLAEKLKSLKNIIIFHGDEDDVVPYKNAEEIFLLANEPKKLIKQKKGDHRMSNMTHQKEFLNEIMKWYLNS